jgi:hypothetical protein
MRCSRARPPARALLERVQLALDGDPVVAQVGLLGLEEGAGPVELVPCGLERGRSVRSRFLGLEGHAAVGFDRGADMLVWPRRLRLSSGRFWLVKGMLSWNSWRLWGISLFDG